MKITYLHSDNEWYEYPAFVQQLVQEHGARKICDVGGGANPVLPLQFVNDNQLDCTVLDISSAELEKAPNGYKKLVQDIEIGELCSYRSIRSCGYQNDGGAPKGMASCSIKMYFPC